MTWTRFFAHNQAAKLGSFLVAVLLWVFAVSGATRTGLFPGTIPLAVNNVSSQLTATANVDAVRVRLAADPAVWRQLTPGSFSASVDVAGQATGLVELPVQLVVSIPNVQVIEVLPKTVEVQLEPLATKVKTVEVKTDGEPAGGFFASTATTDPETVTLRGGQSVLDRVDKVTAVVHVGGASTDQEETVDVQAIDSAGRAIAGLSFTPASVRVRQPLTKLAASKTVGVRVVTTGTPPSGKLVSPTSTQPTSVTVAGSAAQLSSIGTVPTKPIDVSSITGRTTIHTTLDVPAGLSVVGGAAVDVTFDVADHDAVLAVTAKLVFTGLAADRHVTTVDPAAPTVVIRGAASQLAKLASDDITLTIDLTGQSAGTSQHTLSSVQLQLPDGVTVQQLITTAVTVTVQ